MPARSDSPQDVEVQLIELFLRQTPIAYVSKTNGAQFDGGNQLQFRFLRNQVAQLPGVRQIFLDGLPQRSDSVIPQ